MMIITNLASPRKHRSAVCWKDPGNSIRGKVKHDRRMLLLIKLIWRMKMIKMQKKIFILSPLVIRYHLPPCQSTTGTDMCTVWSTCVRTTWVCKIFTTKNLLGPYCSVVVIISQVSSCYTFSSLTLIQQLLRLYTAVT